MTKPAQRYEVDRAKKIQKIVKIVGGCVLYPIMALVLAFLAVQTWLAGWGWVVIVLGLFGVFCGWMTFYDHFVWGPLSRAQHYGVVDE